MPATHRRSSRQSRREARILLGWAGVLPLREEEIMRKHSLARLNARRDKQTRQFLTVVIFLFWRYDPPAGRQTR